MIPKLTDKVRLKIYKKALNLVEEVIKGTKIVYGLGDSPALCLLLPCIWNEVHFMEDFKDNKGVHFTYYDTKKYFPEVKNRLNERFNNALYERSRNSWRKQTLQQAIRKLEKKINS